MVPILYEDLELIVVIKPAGMPSQKDRSMSMDLMTTVERYLIKTHQETTPYVGIVHRLDRPVGGIMVLAKNKKASSHLSRQLQNKSFEKTYIALIQGQVEHDQGHLVDYIVKNHKNVSAVVDKQHHQSKEAILDYQVIKKMSFENQLMSLVTIQLKTGRHHQIRVQMAYHNMPIWGDTKYNPAFMKKDGWFQIALFSTRLAFVHPITGKLMVFHAMPDYFPVDISDTQLPN
ncbi:MAG: RluA family pseudouridine synthase [Vallitaleaceae bacterium]|nr:RluA family pseudouridine synthase [Vallitaleaceae bacterium]